MMQHKTVSLADQVFEHLETDILSGKYARGEILTESKLSAELGVSRTPIREALRRLEQEHIIEESGKGSIVIGITENDLIDIFLIREKRKCPFLFHLFHAFHWRKIDFLMSDICFYSSSVAN